MRFLLWATLLLAAISAHASQPSAYISLGVQGEAKARVLTSADSCPALAVEGKIIPMQLRAEPRTAPMSDHKPALFSERVCELNLPANTQKVSLNGAPLPKINHHPKKIVLLGDTGCRMKLPTSFQSCNDPNAWPLAQVAKQAAQEHPDLVVHVGDYHYREHHCLAPGCAGSPSGYGSDTWQKDFFEPLRPLLEAAPWVFARGNHESCERAGQGWYRYLDPRPYSEKQNCDQSIANEADITAPYAVPINPKLQIIVMDSASAQDTKTPPELVAAYATMADQVVELSQQKSQSWLLMHHPLLGYGYKPLTGYYSSNATLLTAWKKKGYAGLLPEAIPMIIEGHFHTFELNRFNGQAPLSLLTGYAGSALEPEFPQTLPTHFEVTPGIEIAESYSDQHFGYTVVEEKDNQWILQQKDVNGKTQLTCSLQFQNTPRTFQCKR